MRTIILFFSVLLFLTCKKGTHSKETSILLKNEDKKLLRQIKEIKWPKAYREQDTLLLNNLLGEDFQMIDASGNWYTKADELAWIRENATKYDSFFYEIKRLDVLPNGTAIIAGTGHIFNDTVETVYQSSNVLIKRDGNWKAVSSHVSGIKSTDD